MWQMEIAWQPLNVLTFVHFIWTTRTLWHLVLFIGGAFSFLIIWTYFKKDPLIRSLTITQILLQSKMDLRIQLKWKKKNNNVNKHHSHPRFPLYSTDFAFIVCSPWEKRTRMQYLANNVEAPNSSLDNLPSAGTCASPVKSTAGQSVISISFVNSRH